MSIERIRALPCWQGEISATILKGGLSNESWKVTDGQGTHIVRFGMDFPFHHVFRDREVMAARAAHAAGFAPGVHYSAPGLMVSAFVNARTWSEADMRAAPDRIGTLLRRFHQTMPAHVSGPGAIFWVFHVIRDYARTLADHASRFTPDLPRLLAINAGLEVAQQPMPIVFGHHDLLAGNFLEDESRLWLIDFEYAAFGTAMFDLAGAAGNAAMAPAEEEAMLAAYFGEAPDAARRQSFAAMKCAALMREAMWAMVSEIFLAAPGADYDAHARDYLGRLDAAVEFYQTSYGKI
ncbi:MAG: phosphotransferase [Rhodobacteraceae bacterium]|nr:phosphotransferase [Paracoccaceae bacterium]